MENLRLNGAVRGLNISILDKGEKYNMIIKFKSFVAAKEKNNWKRIAESIHETEAEAQKAASDFAKTYSGSATGTHKYYIFTHKEWENEMYKGISLSDGKTKTWMTNEGNGCVLLFEGKHFEILDKAQ